MGISEYIGSPLGPDTQEIGLVFHIQREKPENPNRIRVSHLLVTVFKIPKSLVNLQLRIVVRNIVRSLESTSSEYFAAIVGLLCCFVNQAPIECYCKKQATAATTT